MSFSTSDTTPRPVVVSLGLGFLALAMTFLQGLETIFKSLFTLVPASELAWGYWMAVSMALLSFAGMMAVLYVLDDWMEGEA